MNQPTGDIVIIAICGAIIVVCGLCVGMTVRA